MDLDEPSKFSFNYKGSNFSEFPSVRPNPESSPISHTKQPCLSSPPRKRITPTPSKIKINTSSDSETQNAVRTIPRKRKKVLDPAPNYSKHNISLMELPYLVSGYTALIQDMYMQYHRYLPLDSFVIL